MPSHFFSLLTVSSLLMFLLYPAFAQEQENVEFKVPELSSPVVDQADLLSPTEEYQLGSMIKRLVRNGGPQVAILTVKTLAGLPIEDASMKVAESWKLGSRDKDDGVLLLISKNERKMRIEVGGGLEGDMTDYEAYLIIDQILSPAFRSGNFIDGMKGFLEVVARKTGVEVQGILQGKKGPPVRLRKPVKAETLGPLGSIFSLLFPFLIVGVFIFLRNRRTARTVASAFLFASYFGLFSGAFSFLNILVGASVGVALGILGPSSFIYFLLGGLLGGGRRGIGHRGFGSGSFGGSGGSFSGGGASGSW